MEKFDLELLKGIYKAPKDSHKGMNGKLMVIGGSLMFHGASLWALSIASKIVDMVFYSSVDENNEIILKNKEEFRNGIVVRRGNLDSFIEDSDAVLIGPGMPRDNGRIGDEESTRNLTEKLLKKFPNKRWILDAGSITEIDPSWLLPLNGNVIITPHPKEFFSLFKIEATSENVFLMAKKYNITILLKGVKDIVCNKDKCVEVSGGNEGMTKGGTGDVLAGLVSSLACKNDLFLAAASGSYINKEAGDSLFKKVGPYFNSSDLVEEIPKVMKELLYG